MGRKRKRQRQLDTAVSTIQRRYGSQSLFKGKPPSAVGATGSVPHISTGFRVLDEALGIGGLPKGALCELLGPATSGKTTIALKFLAQVQAQALGASGLVAYVDQAGYFDPDYAHRCGLDLSRLWVGQPADLVEGLAMAEALVRDGGLAAAVLDIPDFFWSDADAAARLSALIGRLAVPLARSETVLLFLHEADAGRLSSRVAPGAPLLSRGSGPGAALAHTAAVRLGLSFEQWIKHHGDVRGYRVRVEVLKNRAGPAGRTVTLSIEFNGTVRGGNGL